MDEIRKIPPVTRYLVGGTLAITLPILLQLVTIYPIVRTLPDDSDLILTCVQTG